MHNSAVRLTQHASSGCSAALRRYGRRILLVTGEDFQNTINGTAVISGGRSAFPFAERSIPPKSSNGKEVNSIMKEILDLVLKALEVAKAAVSLLRDIKETRRSTKK